MLVDVCGFGAWDGVLRWCVCDVGEKKTELVGDGLLSHRPKPILPWALTGLTAGFEMGPGVPPSLVSPTNSAFHEGARGEMRGAFCPNSFSSPGCLPLVAHQPDWHQALIH